MVLVELAREHFGRQGFGVVGEGVGGWRTTHFVGMGAGYLHSSHLVISLVSFAEDRKMMPCNPEVMRVPEHELLLSSVPLAFGKARGL